MTLEIASLNSARAPERTRNELEDIRFSFQQISVANPSGATSNTDDWMTP